ncbi:MAG: hypothetical protein MZW92_72560 [Comamonadaceae bacterium]|nr:hypothetical protein [Comamonadaceae bacterium]
MDESRYGTSPRRLDAAGALAAAFGLLPVIGQILANRRIGDVDSARFFLEGDLADVPDPFFSRAWTRPSTGSCGPSPAASRS